MIEKIVHPICGYTNFYIANKLLKLKPKNVLDLGGTHKLGTFISCKITNANIREGIDATKLPYNDNSFDITVSCATLEHVKNKKKFLDESIRVAKRYSIHWFPYGKDGKKIENFKKSLGHKHPCTIPTKKDLLPSLKNKVSRFVFEPFISCSEHLLLLSTVSKRINCFKTYKFVSNNKDLFYGTLLFIRI